MKLELLIQYIEGSSDKMLVDRVEAWLAEDATNKTYLEKVRTVWSNIDELRELASIDINKDWAKIEQRLFASDDSRNKKATGNFWRMNSPLMKVAAIFFVVVLFSGLIWFFLGQNPTPNQMAQNFYEFNVPMGQKSSLVLPDRNNFV